MGHGSKQKLFSLYIVLAGIFAEGQNRKAFQLLFLSPSGREKSMRGWVKARREIPYKSKLENWFLWENSIQILPTTEVF